MWAELKVAGLFKTKTPPQKNYLHVFSNFPRAFALFLFQQSWKYQKLGNSLYCWKRLTGFSFCIFRCLFSFKGFQSICLPFRLSKCKTQQTGGGIAGASEDVGNGPWLFCTPFWRNNSITRAFRWICLPFSLQWESSENHKGFESVTLLVETKLWHSNVLHRENLERDRPIWKPFYLCLPTVSL